MTKKIDTLSFSGLLKWEQVESLVDNIKNSGTIWHYVYTQLDDKAVELSAEEASDFIKERMEEIKKLDKVCGWFYVHTVDNPQIIKIYHPRMSGGGCSISTPPPWIIVSIEKPEELADLESYKPVIKTKKNGFFGVFK